MAGRFGGASDTWLQRRGRPGFSPEFPVFGSPDRREPNTSTLLLFVLNDFLNSQGGRPIFRPLRFTCRKGYLAEK
jgi:hypothetical protein